VRGHHCFLKSTWQRWNLKPLRATRKPLVSDLSVAKQLALKKGVASWLSSRVRTEGDPVTLNAGKKASLRKK